MRRDQFITPLIVIAALIVFVFVDYAFDFGIVQQAFFPKAKTQVVLDTCNPCHRNKPVVKVVNVCIDCHKPTAAPAKTGTATYVVKKGDSLSKLAAIFGFRNWTGLYYYGANKSMIDKRNQKLKGSKKYWLHPGQQLELPLDLNQAEKAEKKVAKKPAVKRSWKPSRIQSQSGQFNWLYAGVDQFGNRSISKGIKMFSAPEEVKQSFVALASTPGNPCVINHGDRFEEMLFGNFKLRSNVVWQGSNTLPATCWRTEYGGRVYVLIKPPCTNWAWRVETPPPPPPQPEPTPPPPPQPEPTPPPPPQSEPTPPLPAPSPQPLPPTEEGWFRWEPDYEANVFAGTYWGAQGPSRTSWWGGNAAFFPGWINDNYRAGPSVEAVGWDGWVRSGEKVRFDGHKEVFGAEVQRVDGPNKTIVDVRYGWKTGNVQTPSGYRAREEADIINLNASHTWKLEGERDWPSVLQIGAAADIDLGGNKTSTFNGRRLPDEARPSTTEYSARFRAEGPQGDITPFAQLDGAYAKGPDQFAGEPKAGLKFWDGVFETAAGYRINEGSRNDTAGIGAVLSIDKTVKKIRELMD